MSPIALALVIVLAGVGGGRIEEKMVLIYGRILVSKLPASLRTSSISQVEKPQNPKKWAKDPRNYIPAHHIPLTSIPMFNLPETIMMKPGQLLHLVDLY